MKLDRGLFHDPAMSFVPSRLAGTFTTCDPERFLPAKVADVSREALKNFPHTKRVGNYLLGKNLGEGSFAKVKESMHVLTGEKVAIKVIDKKKAKEDAYVRKNMRREGKILQMVRNSHVVQLYEIMETENSYYLVTELCTGGDLMDHICAKKKLDEKETKKFIREIIVAVHYLHSAGILHRDLKVENLLLDENKHIKIIDFGLSNAVRMSQTKEGSVAQEYCVTQCGSPAYAAPELLGNKKYGPPVDVWSIGVNMYAMLTGNLPFTVEPFNIKTLHQKMLNGEMNQIPETLSKNGKDFLKKLLTPDPGQRLTLQEAMGHPWIVDSKNMPLEPSPFPNKLNADDLDTNILKHMSTHLDYRLSETIRLVAGNMPSNATSTYHMFYRKLDRYNAKMRVQGKVAANEGQLTSSSRSTQNTSGYASRDDVIELLPLVTRDGNPNNTEDVINRQQTTDKKEDGGKTEKQPIVVTTGKPSAESGPIRALHRRMMQNERHVTFHGSEKPSISAKVLSNTGNERLFTKDDENTSPATNQRPYTTEDKTSTTNGDVKLFLLSKDATKRSGSPKIWSNPQNPKKLSTNETKITSNSDKTTTDRPKYSSAQRDLPSIAEKSQTANEEQKNKHNAKTMKSSLFIRKTIRDIKPMSNYSFRPRGAFTDMEAQREKDADMTLNKAFAQYKSEQESENGSRLNTVRTSPEYSVSEPLAKTERKVGPKSSKSFPRKVLIDVKHYERYSRKNGDELPGQIMQMLQSSDPAPSRRGQPVYSSHQKLLNRQSNRNIRMYSKHRLSAQEANPRFNITGERAGINASRMSTQTRDSVSRENKIMISTKDGDSNIQRLAGLVRQSHRINLDSDMDSVSAPIKVHVNPKSAKELVTLPSDQNQDKVVLPDISPNLFNTND